MSRLVDKLRAMFRREEIDEFDDTELFEVQRRNRQIIKDLEAGRMTLDEVREHFRQQASLPR